MSKLVSSCPSCSSPLVVTKLSCTSCDVQLEGQFEIPALAGLEPGDLEFIIDFVKTSGSIKEMAKREGVSYPTMRSRLNALIERLEAGTSAKEMKQSEILDRVAAGEISAADAALLLKELSR